MPRVSPRSPNASVQEGQRPSRDTAGSFTAPPVFSLAAFLLRFRGLSFFRLLTPGTVFLPLVERTRMSRFHFLDPRDSTELQGELLL